MITITKHIEFPLTYPLKQLGSLEDILFFDIETTGFSGDYTNLYLIGCVYYEKGSWILVQWFADEKNAEPELLDAFFSHLKRFKILIHFNGDGFDIPYLLKRCRAFGLNHDFSQIQSLDIYRKIKPYKNLLQLENLKQKSIEKFLGIRRDDLYSGGQLIEVYNDYLMTHDSFLYDLLILHNEDDLKGMPLILPILSYSDFLEDDFLLKDQALGSMRDIFGRDHPVLNLTYWGKTQIPVPFSLERPLASCQAEDHSLEFSIPLYQGTLKYFYPDYKNYYYLTYEDTAVHKSIGEYVDKDARQKATAKNCYTKKEGCFLPQLEPLWQPALKEDHKSKVTYVEYETGLLEDPCHGSGYARQILNYLLSKSS